MRSSILSLAILAMAAAPWSSALALPGSVTVHKSEFDGTTEIRMEGAWIGSNWGNTSTLKMGLVWSSAMPPGQIIMTVSVLDGGSIPSKVSEHRAEQAGGHRGRSRAAEKAPHGARATRPCIEKETTDLIENTNGDLGTCKRLPRSGFVLGRTGDMRHTLGFEQRGPEGIRPVLRPSGQPSGGLRVPTRRLLPLGALGNRGQV